MVLQRGAAAPSLPLKFACGRKFSAVCVDTYFIQGLTVHAGILEVFIVRYERPNRYVAYVDQVGIIEPV